MNEVKAMEFRELLAQFTKEIPEEDALTMLDAIEQLERWIDRYVDEVVTVALERHKKNNKDV